MYARQRLSSTTTRIKTCQPFTKASLSLIVRDYLPLQQGLRRKCPPRPRIQKIVRDYLPLQQGLRLLSNVKSEQRNKVRDYLPLQQGLRLLDLVFLKRLRLTGQRLSSTTTRIKTKCETLIDKRAMLVRDYLPLQQGLRLLGVAEGRKSDLVRDYLPLQQGLRQPAASSFASKFRASETIFHYNKD